MSFYASFDSALLWTRLKVVTVQVIAYGASVDLETPEPRGVRMRYLKEETEVALQTVTRFM